MKSRHLFIIIASCLFFMLSQGFAWADRNVDMLQKQAMDAFKDGNYKLAEELLKNALSIEESDVTWLNLGRTYMRQNRCVEARNAYAKVNLGQALPIVVEKYGEYQKDLIRICSCEVDFICTAPDVKIYVDNFDIGSACGESIHLTSGLHSFREENASGSLNRLMELESDGEVKTVDFKAALAEQIAAANQIVANQTAAATNPVAAADNQQGEEVIPPPEPVDPEVLAKRYSRIRIAGYTLLGGGVAIAAGCGVGLGLEISKFNSYCNNNDCDSGYENYMDYAKSGTELINGWIAGVTVGSVVAVTGVVLAVLGHVLDQSAGEDENPPFEEGETAVHINPVLSVMPSFSGAGILISF